MASSLIGEPRSTVDVDIAIKLDPEAGVAFVERVRGEFFVPIDRGGHEASYSRIWHGGAVTSITTSMSYSP